MAQPTARWEGDNLREINHLLRLHDATAYAHGETLHISGKGIYITLSPGDSLIRDGDRLGVLRRPVEAADPEITWTGMNVGPMAEFLSGYQIRVELFGNTIFIHDLNGREKPVRIEPGDKLIERGGQLIVSKAGRDHQIQ